MAKCVQCGAVAPSVSYKNLTTEQRTFWDGTANVCPVCYRNQDILTEGNSEGFNFGLMVVITLALISFSLISSFDDIEGSYFFPFFEKLEVDAVVVSSTLANKKIRNSRNLYKAEVSFSYKINGKNYISSQLDFYGKWSENYEFEKSLVEYYFPRRKVTAFCKASDHQYCVLRPDINSRRSFLFESIFIILAFGSITFLSYKSYVETIKPNPPPSKARPLGARLATRCSRLWRALGDRVTHDQ